MRLINLPLANGELKTPRKATFAALFAMIAAVRAVLVTALPLEVYAVLGDVQKVSVLYTTVAVVGLIGALLVPALVARFRRRWVFSLGALSAVVAAGLFLNGGLPFLIGGLILQAFALTAMEVTLNLFLMDYVPRKELSRFEPLRIFVSAGVWTLAPWSGVLLRTEVAVGAPYVAMATMAVATLGFFWYLRFTDDPAVRPARKRPVNPLKHLGRFFRQPRLALAWGLAVGRAGWWYMFFVYAPILVVHLGFGEERTGMVVSAGMACVFAVPIWGLAARRWGVRKLLFAGYLLSGVATFTVATAFGTPWLAVTLMIGAALATSLIDGAGNVPFFRAVHPYERPEMTSVFTTYRDFGQLAPPAVFSVLLQSFRLPAVFAAAAVGMAGLAWLSRFIPRRL